MMQNIIMKNIGKVRGIWTPRKCVCKYIHSQSRKLASERTIKPLKAQSTEAEYDSQSITKWQSQETKYSVEEHEDPVHTCETLEEFLERGRRSMFTYNKEKEAL